MSLTLLWCDLETTGLDPAKHKIVEAAFATAPIERPWELTFIYDKVIRLGHFASDWAHVSSEVYEMHAASGLMEAVKAAELRVADAEEELLELVPEFEAQDSKWILAGSTIHFDKSFLAKHMPNLFERLSYRLYDVRVMQLFARGMGMPAIRKKGAHRARADIEESAESLLAVTEWLSGRDLGVF